MENKLSMAKRKKIHGLVDKYLRRSTKEKRNKNLEDRLILYKFNFKPSTHIYLKYIKRIYLEYFHVYTYIYTRLQFLADVSGLIAYNPSSDRWVGTLVRSCVNYTTI